jgi:hypothetical protein
MAKKAEPAAPPAKVALYEKLVAAFPGVERKGASIPYTSMNGNMFSCVTKSGDVTLRLPEGPREKFIAKYGTKLSEQYGIVQKEYVVVPDALLSKTAELAKWFAVSLEYVRSLAPKATTRPKKAAAMRSAKPTKKAATKRA